MNVTAAAIRNNRVTFLVLLVLVIGGISTYNTLPRSEDPGFIVRTAMVMTYFPGASPERVEQLITDKLEKVIQEMPELDFVTSESRTGISYIFVNIQAHFTKMRPIWDSLRRKVDSVRGDLPQGTSGPFVNDDFGDVFPIMLTITGDGLNYAELKLAADEVRDELLRLEEVAKVDIFGAQDERIFVEYNNARLAEVGLSPIQLKSILEARNIINPGGSVSTGIEQIVLEPSGNFESVEELQHTMIRLPGRPTVVYLNDLAHVHRGYVDPPESKMRSTGIPSLGLSISIREGGNLIALGQQVRELLPRLDEVYPIGVDFDVVIFQPDLVDKQIRDFSGSLLQAIVIVLVVMLLFLGPRTGLVVAIQIPTTILVSILLMPLFGIGLDQISIAALIMALGMLVDNAIVMSESIMVQIADGKNRFKAAVDSARELKIPLLVSSLTTAAAFSPIYLAESEVGEYCASLFKLITIALLCSWGLSLTMMPLLCHLFLKVKPASPGKKFTGRFYTGYRVFLVGLLRRRLITILSVAVAFFLAMFGMGFVPNIFFPPSDTPRMIAELDMPLGTAIERTEAVVSDIEQFILDEMTVGEEREDGFLNWSTYIGSQPGPLYRLGYIQSFAGNEHSSMILSASSREFIDRVIPRLQSYCDETFPDLVSKWNPENLGPPVEFPIQVRISGRSMSDIYPLVDRVSAKLREIPGTRNVQDDWGARTKKLKVNINQARARRSGVTSQDVAVSLQSGLSGFATTEFREGDKVIPIVLRSVAADRQDLGKLESLNIYAQSTGESVPLKQIADIEMEWEASKILRRDRMRTVTVRCDTEVGVLAADIDKELIPWLASEAGDWPFGSFYERGGEIESSVEANDSINAKLPIAFLIILLLLISQFNSVRRMLIVLLCIPLGMIGVTIGLLATGAPFGFMTLLGVISLAGIIINNAIVLIDRIRIEIEENGLEPAAAIIASAQKRLRPILLTTATTIGGLLPLWLNGSPMFVPMAITIIFGLLFATVLTLGVVPVLYSIFFRVRFHGFRAD